jgi:capsular polysaccharide export protein
MLRTSERPDPHLSMPVAATGGSASGDILGFDLGGTGNPSLLGRKILFLQGPSSRFFAHSARACRALGAEVLRIAFAPGDRLYWDRKAGRCVTYTGKPEDFAAWFADFQASEQVSDVVMLGDGRVYHQAALAVLKGSKTTPWIVEQGYLRPGLIAVEIGGTGGRSPIPEAFGDARRCPVPVRPKAPASSFLRYGALDLVYHLANLIAGRALTPHYKHHALVSPLAEYAGWLMKAVRWPKRRWQQAIGRALITAHTGPVFLLALQLPGDYQIRHHGTGETMAMMVHRVVRSFARHAPQDAMLVVKEHPLDNGLVDWRALSRRAALGTGLEDRVVHLPQGDASDLFDHLSGVVSVNSTVGLSALLARIPALAMGRAIYRLPGLAAEQSLDDFWQYPQRPDPLVVRDFRAFLQHKWHIKGSFDGPGALQGATNLALRLAEGAGR